jgi:hypothetical protein
VMDPVINPTLNFRAIKPKAVAMVTMVARLAPVFSLSIMKKPLKNDSENKK